MSTQNGNKRLKYCAHLNKQRCFIIQHARRHRHASFTGTYTTHGAEIVQQPIHRGALYAIGGNFTVAASWIIGLASAAELSYNAGFSFASIPPAPISDLGHSVGYGFASSNVEYCGGKRNYNNQPHKECNQTTPSLSPPLTQMDGSPNSRKTLGCTLAAQIPSCKCQ